MITWLTSSNTPFISKEKEKYVINHKYKGSNFSYWSNGFVTPVNELLLDYVVPEWVAPNLITLAALAVNAAPCFWLYFVYGGEYVGYISPMMCYTIGISF